jgi:predicted transcriptional regulator
LKLFEIQKILRAEDMTQKVDLGIEVQVIKASDLMSDVLSFCGPGALLITGLTNAQAVRTAQLAELCGIVFVRGKRPSKETILMAQERGIPVLATDFPMYEACGILYSHGLAGIQDKRTADDE